MAGLVMKRRRVESDMVGSMDRVATIVMKLIDPLPPDFPFKPACPEIPILKRYDVPPPASFWKSFPSDRNRQKGSPFKLLPDVLRKCVAKSNPSSTTEWLLERVIKDIVDGVDLRVKDGYTPTRL